MHYKIVINNCSHQLSCLTVFTVQHRSGSMKLLFQMPFVIHNDTRDVYTLWEADGKSVVFKKLKSPRETMTMTKWSLKAPQYCTMHIYNTIKMHDICQKAAKRRHYSFTWSKQTINSKARKQKQRNKILQQTDLTNRVMKYENSCTSHLPVHSLSSFSRQ